MVMLVLKKKYIFFIFKVKLFNMDLEDSKMNRGVYTPAWFTIIFFKKSTSPWWNLNSLQCLLELFNLQAIVIHFPFAQTELMKLEQVWRS